MPLSDLLPDFERALDAEIAAAKQQGGVRYHLTQGAELGQAGRGFVYRFRLTRPCSIQDDSGVSVYAGSQRVEGTVVSIDEQEVVLSLDERLEEPRQAEMTVNLWYILECLLTRLGHPSRRASTMFDAAGPSVPAPPAPSGNPAPAVGAATPNPEQKSAVAAGRQAGVRFIWGPPGTGKTRTVAALAACAVAAGDRVLVLTFSNDALDVATMAVLDAATRLPDREPLLRAGQIIRLGTARHPAVVAHKSVTPLAALRTLEPELMRKHDQLRAKEATLRTRRPVNLSRMAEIRTDLRLLRQTIREREDRLARDARIVLCTLARLATAEALDDVRFDTVIVDEASMVSIPYSALASTFARRTVVYAGDFRQLPPVVQSRDEAAERWLTRSVFDHADIPRRISEGCFEDPRMVLLAEQYRMTPPLADRVSRVFYGGRLRTADTVVAQPRDGAAFIDIAELWPYCQAEPQHLGHSRFNVMSALVSLALARRAAHEIGGTVGIVAPFSAQASLLRAMAVDLGLGRLRISTVHRFQGSEVDTMVLDLTTARGHNKLGFLLGGDIWSTAGRLLNVAASRARRALLVVGDWSHLERCWRNLGDRYPSEALFQLLDGLGRYRLRPDDLRDEHGGFLLPSLPGASFGGSDPGPRWPVRIHDGSLHHGRASHSVELVREQLLVAVRPGQAPAEWVLRSANNGASVAIRGRDLAVEWRSGLGRGLTLEYAVPCEMMVADGERFAVTLRPRASEAARTILVTSPSAAPLVASLGGIVPSGVRLVRAKSLPAVDDLPPDDTSVPVKGIDPSDIEIDEVPTEPGVPDSPSICPVSHHRLKILLLTRPMRLKCVETSCSFNADDESINDAEGGHALTDVEAIGLLQRAGPIYLSDAASENLFCGMHAVAPRVRRVTSGLRFECPGCFGWRRDYPALPDALLVP